MVAMPAPLIGSLGPEAQPEAQSDAQREAGPDGSAQSGADGAVPSIHPNAWIAPGAVVVGSVTIGRDASIWYGAVLRADDDEIIIGEECNIQDLCCLHVDASEPAILEPRVSLGHHATVHGAHIEQGALVGMGAVVLGGARVGAGSLIAAGAVVLAGQHIPPGVLFAGVPGRVVRDLSDADRERITRTWQSYVGRGRRHRQARWSAAAVGSPAAVAPVREHPSRLEPLSPGKSPGSCTSLVALLPGKDDKK
jgi:carbonic anhydrase/acetyltransferase-like protein (isoleucine patch superfamily)